MCGRYAIFGPHSRYRDHFQVGAWPDVPDRYNVALSMWLPVIRQAPDGRRVADLLRWGLVPNWAKDEAIGAKLNNARGETVSEKPSFRSAYRRRRCIVPAAGFYEWQPVPGQKWKQPWFIRLLAGEPMGMGGLWESWTNPAGEVVRTFCVVTTAANELMAPIHDRMPVVLQPEDWTAWLAPDTAPEQVAPLVRPAAPETMEAWPVSRKVSSAREDGPELVERIGELVMPTTLPADRTTAGALMKGTTPAARRPWVEPWVARNEKPAQRLLMRVFVVSLAEGQGFEPWRGLHPCRFSVPTIAFATRSKPVCGLDFAFTVADNQRQVGAVKSLHVPGEPGFARRYLGRPRGSTEFDSLHLPRFRNSARVNKTGAFNRSANLPSRSGL